MNGVKFGPRPLIWYPDNMGWYLPVSKHELKSKKFVEFRKWLMLQFDQGNLNRQEAVSMIPPLLLDVQPDHYVLDMCAAPGSKTAQLLESLHGNGIGFSVPKGMVIANDSDPRRAYMLVHQLKRLGSPCFLVTTHEGQFYPNLYSKTPPPSAPASLPTASSAAASASSSSTSSASPSDRIISFDRILCDVPCSGDGTLRKNMNLWKTWGTSYANGLHTLQLIIAIRASYLLKVNGYMVYSTCSFNPIENEAVVAELIRRSQGALELVDVSNTLKGLKRTPGLSTWKVVHKDFKEVDWEAESSRQSHASIQSGTFVASKFRKSMFPPTAEEAAEMHLERCMRILPHHQDTGGFFISLLRKKQLLPGQRGRLPVTGNATAASISTSSSSTATDSAQTTATETAPTATEEEEKLEGAPDAKEDEEALAAAAAVSKEVAALDEPESSPSSATPSATSSSNMEDEHHPSFDSGKVVINDDPFRPMPSSVVEILSSFYGMDRSVNTSNIFSRSDDSKKCYYVGPAIAEVMLSEKNTRLKVVHSGSRCFERTPNRPGNLQYECEYRVVQEGIDAIFPHITKQILELPFAHFMVLLQKESIALRAHEGRAEKFSQDLLALKSGCVIVKFAGAEAEKISSKPLLLCCWKTDKSLTVMMQLQERQTLVSLLTGKNMDLKPVKKVKMDD